MDSVQRQWQSATALDAGSGSSITADQLRLRPAAAASSSSSSGGVHQDATYRLGRLLITSVSVLDAGLKGGGPGLVSAEEDGDGEEDAEAEAERQALKDLGLPTSFGGDSRAAAAELETQPLQASSPEGAQPPPAESAAAPPAAKPRRKAKGQPEQPQRQPDQQSAEAPSNSELSPQACVRAVRAFRSIGYDLLAVWSAVGMQLAPENTGAAHIYAAARALGCSREVALRVLRDAAGAPGHRTATTTAAAAAAPVQLHQEALRTSGLGSGGPEQPAASTSTASARTGRASARMPPKAATEPYGPRFDSPWQQEYDPATGLFYYFDLARQITQWEAPFEGYRPYPAVAPSIAAHDEPDPEPSPQQDHLPGPLPQQPNGPERSPQKQLSGKSKQQGKPQLQQPGGVAQGGSKNPTNPGGWVTLDAATAARVRQVLPRNMSKYWLQRYSLFSKYDEGIQMDTEGWYSVTPEVLACHQAAMCRAYSPGHLAMDVMAGCGGNSIQLAQEFSHVTCVEMSSKRIGMIATNLEVYTVRHKADLVCCDFFSASHRLLADVVFASPPWGGPKYHWSDSFDVTAALLDQRHSIRDLLKACLEIVERTSSPLRSSAASPSRGSEAAGHAELSEPTGAPGAGSRRGVVVLFLPRNTNLVKLEALVPDGLVWHVECGFLNGVFKGISVYCFSR